MFLQTILLWNLPQVENTESQGSEANAQQGELDFADGRVGLGVVDEAAAEGA